MATLYIASNYITTGFGHLQIVYQDGTSFQEIEVQAPPIPLTFVGDWRYPSIPRDHTTAANTPHYGEAEYYKRTAITLLPGQDATSTWELLKQLHGSFQTYGAQIDYNAGQNSNAYANTLLWAIGISLSSYNMLTTKITTLPSSSVNVLMGADTSTPNNSAAIAVKVALTSGNDYLRTGIGNDSIGGGVAGTSGNDTIWTGDGTDSIAGGSGTDKLYGEGGNDILYGGLNGDTLDGGYGTDLINGGGGRDYLNGGPDGVRDNFDFWNVSDSVIGASRDVIATFKSGIDNIYLNFIDANTVLSGDQSFLFNGVTARANRIWYVDTGTDILVRGDVNGDTTADFEIQISAINTVVSTDFWL